MSVEDEYLGRRIYIGYTSYIPSIIIAIVVRCKEFRIVYSAYFHIYTSTTILIGNGNYMCTRTYICKGSMILRQTMVQGERVVSKPLCPSLHIISTSKSRTAQFRT